MKTAVVYWSGTGNTKQMAEIIADSAKSAGAEVDVFDVNSFSADQMDAYDRVAFGCPAMGNEELEDTEFLPVYEECRAKLQGKEIALFGSYSWAEGEWMQTWEAQAKEDGAVLVAAPVIAFEAPEGDSEEACVSLGKSLAS